MADRVDLGVSNDDAVADDADVRAARDQAARDHAASDRADLGSLEQLSHLGATGDLFDDVWRQHANEGGFDVLGQLVDDLVGANVDALALGKVLRLAVRADVEAHDDRLRGGREHDIGFGDTADARVDDTNGDLFALDLVELGDCSLDGALHVALDDEVEVANLAVGDLLEEVLERNRLLAATRQFLGTQTRGAPLGEVTSVALRVDDAANLTGRRWLIEADDLDRIGRTSGRHLDAVLVEHDAHLAPRIAGDNCVAWLERAALYQHRGDRTATNIETRLHDRTRGWRVRVGFQLEHIGLEQEHLEQAVEACL